MNRVISAQQIFEYSIATAAVLFAASGAFAAVWALRLVVGL